MNTADREPHLPAVVGPGAELKLALLVIEGEPGDVDLAGGLEDARRHVQAAAVVFHDDVCVIGAVEFLVGTATSESRRFLLAG